MERQIFSVQLNGRVYFYAYPIGLYAAFKLPVKNLTAEFVVMTENGYEAILDLVCEGDNIPTNELYVRENYIIVSMNDLLRDKEKLLQCLEEDRGLENYFIELHCAVVAEN